MATEWLDYNTPNIDGGTRTYNGLDVWVSASNNGTYDITSTTSQLILWFDAGYTYNNLELAFNLVKND